MGGNPAKLIKYRTIGISTDYRNGFCQNEELNLPSCLEKLSRFDQIIVVDSGSTDDTMNIAYIWAEVLQFHWNGKFLKNAIGHFKMPICCMNGSILMRMNLFQMNL
jgi:hypothetical protein